MTSAPWIVAMLSRNEALSFTVTEIPLRQAGLLRLSKSSYPCSWIDVFWICSIVWKATIHVTFFPSSCHFRMTITQANQRLSGRSLWNADYITTIWIAAATACPSAAYKCRSSDCTSLNRCRECSFLIGCEVRWEVVRMVFHEIIISISRTPGNRSIIRFRLWPPGRCSQRTCSRGHASSQVQHE